MASEIRVNKIENRSGLGTVTFADTGVDLAGIVTATTFSGSGASLTSLPAAQLSGTLPAISAANLTNVPAANITGTLPAISAANLTNVPAANITGTLPAISAANLTNIPAANVTGTLPALTAANLTNIPAANLVGVCTSGLTKTGGFGSWVKMLTTTVTSDVNNVQFQNTQTEVDFSTYKVYALLISGLRPASDDYTLRYRIYDSNGEYSSSEYKNKLNTDQGNYNQNGETSGMFCYNGIGNNTGGGGSLIYEDFHAVAYMHGFAVNRRFNMHGQSSFLDNASGARNQSFAGGPNVETETTGIKIFSSSGNINLGTFTLFGLAT